MYREKEEGVSYRGVREGEHEGVTRGEEVRGKGEGCHVEHVVMK